MKAERQPSKRDKSELSGDPDEKECGTARLARALQELLAQLAEPLMQAGVTPGMFGDFVEQAFVRAACRASTLRNGRVNQSRVAVLTGLSRAEVRKVLRGSRKSVARHRPRSTRVLQGWVSDPRFTKRDGTPLSLRINGPSPSFTKLVREYAGDVPPQAVLEELRRLKAVRETDRRVELISTAVPRPAALLKLLKLVLPIISDGLALSADRISNSSKAIHRLTLKTADSRQLVTIYDRAVTGATSFLNGLGQSLQSSSYRKSRAAGHQVTVSVLVRRQGLDQKARRHRDAAA